jgi:hypothetical protein
MHIPSNFVQVHNAFSLRYKRIEKFHNANLFENTIFASPFQGFGSRLIASFSLHLRKQEGGRVVKALDITIRMSTPLWVRSSCVSRFQGTFSSSGFRRFSRLKYRAPPTRLVTLREPHICKTVVHFAIGKLAFKFTIPSHSRCEFDLRLYQYKKYMFNFIDHL